MFPTLPENIWRALFFIGVILTAYSFLQQQNLSDHYQILSQQYDMAKDSSDRADATIKELSEHLKAEAERIQMTLDCNQFLKETKNGFTYNRTYHGYKVDELATKEFDPIWFDYKHKYNVNQLIINEKNRDTKRINESIQENNGRHDFWETAKTVGFLIMTLGFLISYSQDLDNKFEKNDKKQYYKNCQSCGKLFGGTVQHSKFSDGEINELYCNKCFRNNKFIDPNLTIQKVIKDYYLATGNQNRIGRFFTKIKFSNLRRWANGDY